MTKKKYWAALGKDAKVIAVGVDLAERKFDYRCIDFRSMTFELWHYYGARYCQLDIPNRPLQYIGQNIAKVPHKKIRMSKSSFSIMAGL